LIDRFTNLLILTLLPRDQLFPVDRMLKERQTMATAEKPPYITTDPELQAAVERVRKGVREPEAMRQAAKRMDRMREETRHRVGNVDLAVPLIRATREEEGSIFPNPSVVVRQILEDGSEVEVIWSWLGETRQAKLVTVYLVE
jgi:hypothetical protein